LKPVRKEQGMSTVQKTVVTQSMLATSISSSGLKAMRGMVTTS